MIIEKTEINGVTYSASAIAPIKQFHIARKLAPVLASLAPMLKGLADISKDNALEKLGALNMDSMANALASMSDEDAEAVLCGLLAAVKREIAPGAGYAPMVVNGQIAYQDVTLPDLMKLAALSFKVNLAGFFNAAR